MEDERGARQSEGKFSTNWEGSFRIQEVARNGAYQEM